MSEIPEQFRKYRIFLEAAEKLEEAGALPVAFQVRKYVIEQCLPILSTDQGNQQVFLSIPGPCDVLPSWKLF